MPGDQWQVVWDYQKENLDAFRISHTVNQTIFNTFVFGSKYGIHFVSEDGEGPAAIVIGHGTDGSKKGVYLEGAAEQGLTFINTELVSMSTTDKVYITAGEGFDSEATFFNTSMWGGTTRSVDLLSGKLNLQQANFTVVGERGINALGGEITLYNSYFQQPGTTHIYAGPDIISLMEAANIFEGDLRLENHAPGKVRGTDLKPISLEVSSTGYDPLHPEQLASILTLNNLSEPQDLKGKIEIVQPSDYAGKFVPLRFEGVGPGESLSIKVPFITSDAAKFKITLDNGRIFMTTSQIGQSLLLNENDGSGRSAFMEYNQGIGTSKDATLFGDLYLLNGDYSVIVEDAAELAVHDAIMHKDYTHLDAALSFVNLLPEGEARTRLTVQLAIISMELLLQWMDHFKEMNEIKHSLYQTMSNEIKQSAHHSKKGHIEQAVKHVENALKNLDNSKPSDRSEAAAVLLKMYLENLIELFPS